MSGPATPEREIYPIVAALHNVSRQTVAHHWKEIRSIIQNHDNDNGKDYINNPATAPPKLFDDKVDKRRGSKVKCDRAQIKAKAKAIPFSRCQK